MELAGRTHGRWLQSLGVNRRTLAELGVGLWLLFSAGVWLAGGCTERRGSQAATAAPQIKTSPVSQMARVGGRATLTVEATGSEPLRYDWRRDGFSLDAASGAKYVTPALTEADDGSSFVVVVSNEAGSVMSSEARVTVR